MASTAAAVSVSACAAPAAAAPLAASLAISRATASCSLVSEVWVLVGMATIITPSEKSAWRTMTLPARTFHICRSLCPMGTPFCLHMLDGVGALQVDVDLQGVGRPTRSGFLLLVVARPAHRRLDQVRLHRSRHRLVVDQDPRALEQLLGLKAGLELEAQPPRLPHLAHLDHRLDEPRVLAPRRPLGMAVAVLLAQPLGRRGLECDLDRQGRWKPELSRVILITEVAK